MVVKNMEMRKGATGCVTMEDARNGIKIADRVEADN
jgi:hypothetical protein